MASTLAWLFGGIMTIALAIVIAGSWISAGRTTMELVIDKTNLVLDHVQEEVERYLRPAEHALIAAAEFIEESGGDLERVDDQVAGILKSMPQLGGIALVSSNGTLRFLGEPPPDLPKFIQVDTDQSAFEPSAEPGIVWSAPFWSPTSKTTIINAHLRLPKSGGQGRFLVTGVFITRFAEHLNDLASDIGQDVFVLHGRDQVIGYSGLELAEFNIGPSAALPELASIEQPVLRNIWASKEELGFDIGNFKLDGDARLVIHNDVPFGLFFREVDGFSRLPWLVGMQINLEETDDDFRRLIRSGLIALGISFLAVVLVLRIGKRLSRPIEALAARAEMLQRLPLPDLPDLPPSRIAELDQANRTFNTMGNVLHWFETYLPKRLVGFLIETGAPDAIPSEEREVTIMFTDIVAFSSRAAMLSPSETAQFLNDHFETIEQCVAAEDGLIDKYIGDSVMAFWGAPQAQPDHAARAVRTALRIRDALAQGDIGLRIGIHTGKVLVGNIGASSRLNYTIVGEAVNIAQRIEQFGRELPASAKVTIVASQSTLTLSGAPSDARGHDLGMHVLRGQNEPLRLIEL